jgi:hypothetical protein
MKENRRPILVNGELYSKPIEKRPQGRPNEPAIRFEEARTKLLGDLSKTREIIKGIPIERKLPNEVVLCVRMRPEFSAKSYYPQALFDPKFGIQEIGSRLWKTETTSGIEKDEDVTLQNASGKLFFIRATNKSLDDFTQQLDKSPSTKKFALDVRRVSSLNLLDPEEQILGFKEDWNNGRLEAVLHPFSIDNTLAIDHFISILVNSGTDSKKINVKQYGNGVTFLSFLGNKNILNAISGYNPLRTVHPLTMRPFALGRGGAISGGPIPPTFTKKPSIVVGVLDGGVSANNPYLINYVEKIDSVSEPEDPGAVAHGTQVSGAVLYGALNSYSQNDTLPEPQVSVRNFRLFSEFTTDPDLYEAIDAIEEIVPNNPDIKVYNLSIGPAGPILDDSISRFTFSCDILSKEHEVLFCTAVGNDGDRVGYDRIQSPSDMVNGLAIGAYSKINSPHDRAFYSCVGPGREGNKKKPDLLAFGGCDQLPIHLVGNRIGEKIWNLGTSFATPIVSSFAGKLIGGTNNMIDALSSRALIIHSAMEKSGAGHSFQMGYGILPEDFNEVITCSEKGYTLIYKGELEPTKYAEFSIPWVTEKIKGNVTIRWTTAILTNVDQNSPDDYTSSSIVTAFYPNKNKYTFRKDGKTKTVDILNDPDLVTTLTNEKWKRDNFPKSDSKQQYKSEDELRQQELKWDTMDSRNISKKSSSLEYPVLHVHAISRGSNTEKVKFAIILTLEAPKATIDIYQTVLDNYGALVPIKLNIDVPITIQT